ncbi:MAG: hypothetical protein HDS99_00575 [Bacteroidales bacterium]|nr:hypothetical protein [Bacteroidales bacterium]
MSVEDIPRNPIPWYFWLVTVLCVLPLGAYPVMIADLQPDSPARTFVLLYPAYVVVSAVCALICYGRRPEVSWVLLALMVLTHIAMWILVTDPVLQ